MAFTEQGVSMLSSVLRSEKAILMNIEIMRAFARYRAIIKESEELRKDIKNLDNKINRAFKYLLEKIDALHQQPKEDRKKIGYKS
jgi:phosphate uptake regulator